MRRHECTESRRIASTESLSADDQRHLSTCALCADYVRVERALVDIAKETIHTSRMPAAGTVFVRARILEKKQMLAEVARPMLIFQKVAYGIIIACWVVFAVMQWTPFVTWMGGLDLSPMGGIESRESLPLSFFWMFAVLSMMTMMTMLHGLWTEEHAL